MALTKFIIPNRSTIPGRLKIVSSKMGITYVNDASASITNETAYSLQSIEGKIIWITGDIHNDRNYNLLGDLIEEKVRCIIHVGVKNVAFMTTFMNKIEMYVQAATIPEAVNIAAVIRKNNEAVLFSPGCSIINSIKGADLMGDQFEKTVNELPVNE